MNENRVLLNIKNKVALVTLNRVNKENSFDESMYSALENVTEELKKKLPRAVIITGAGEKAFSAGFDVSFENPLVADVMGVIETHDIEPADRLIKRIRRAVDKFMALPVPIIAALNGLAYGGGAEFAARCDMRVMDRTAQICFSEVRLGLMPDTGGGPYLTRLIGPANAADLILTARNINADEAFKIGLVNSVCDKGKAVDKAFLLAEQIAQNGPRAIRSALAVIRHSQGLSMEKALKLEAEMAAKLIASGECMYGITGFMEKKNPKFPD